jgi:Na+/proline symporter
VNDAWRVLVAVVALFALTCGVLAAAWTRGRLGVVSVSLFVVSVVVWALDFAAVSSGYHDADGLFDCRESCTGVHYVSAFGFLAPPLLISLSALAMLVLLVRRRRARRGR